MSKSTSEWAAYKFLPPRSTNQQASRMSEPTNRSSAMESCPGQSSANDSPTSDDGAVSEVGGRSCQCCVTAGGSDPRQHDLASAARPQPLAIFWDIENCQVPKHCTASGFVAAVRDRFLTSRHWETEFMCACDVGNASAVTMTQLNDAQVNVLHVPAVSKNAADDRIKQCIRRFSDQFAAPATAVVITGDMNFAPDLCFLRLRKRVHVILVHNRHARQSLLACADQCFTVQQVVSSSRGTRAEQKYTTGRRDCRAYQLLVSGLPAMTGWSEAGHRWLSCQLRRLVDNCGGRVRHIDLAQRHAVLAFSSPDSAARAKYRLHNAVICGHRTYVSFYNGGAASDTAKVAGMSGESAAIDDLGQPGRDDCCAPVSNADCATNESTAPQLLSTLTSTVPHHTASQPHSLSPTHSSGLSSSSAADATQSAERGDYDCPTVGNKRDSSCTVDHAGEDGRVVASAVGRVWAPVQLTVTNLDPGISTAQLETTLRQRASQHAKVLSVCVQVLCDGAITGAIVVGGHHDAQATVAHMHRALIGTRRISLSYIRSTPTQPLKVQWQVISVLADVPTMRLPLVAFMELYEQRYHGNISVSDLFRMRDTVNVSDSSQGRVIHLTARAVKNISLGGGGGGRVMSRAGRCPLHSAPVVIATEPARASRAVTSSAQPTSSPLPHCVAAAVQSTLGWAEPDDASLLPCSQIQLRQLAPIVARLLHAHNGSMYLASFIECYAATSGDRELCLLQLNPDAVCLEYLIDCLPGVAVVQRHHEKLIVHTAATGENIEGAAAATLSPNNEMSAVSPMLQQKVQSFSREVIDLLRASPRTRLPFCRFIPCYHAHFGRQCRVSEYGFTRLSDLLDAMPHIVQILGSGRRRQITLTQRCQQRRFLADLLRVLKCQPLKQLAVAALSAAFSDALTGARTADHGGGGGGGGDRGGGVRRRFSVWDYGATNVLQMLDSVCGDSVVMYKQNGEAFVALPRRGQTSDEIQRTQTFATEARDLLRHLPHARLQFNKFMPAYHHHYGRQCRVADYGFVKLHELFDHCAHTVQVTYDGDGEKVVQLTVNARKHILAEQVVQIVRDSDEAELTVDQIASRYVYTFGYHLDPSEYDHTSLHELLGSLFWAVSVSGHGIISAVDTQRVAQISARTRLILMETVSGGMSLKQFMDTYSERYGQAADMKVIRQLMPHLVQVSGGRVWLLPLQLVARHVMHVLRRQPGRQMSLWSLWRAWPHHQQRQEGVVSLRPAHHGYHSVPALLSALHDTVHLQQQGSKRYVCLLPEFCVGNGENEETTHEANTGTASTTTTTNQQQTPPPQHDHVGTDDTSGCSNNLMSVTEWPGVHVSPPNLYHSRHSAMRNQLPPMAPLPPPVHLLPSPMKNWLSTATKDATNDATRCEA